MNGTRALTLAVLIGAASLGLQGCGADDASASSGNSGYAGTVGSLLPQSPRDTGADDPQTRSGDSVTVSWIPPVQRQDGTPLLLQEIQEYRIHYGNSPGDYTDVIIVAGGYSETTEIRDLASGERIYVAVEAVDMDGLVSGPSDEVNLLVN